MMVRVWVWLALAPVLAMVQALGSSRGVLALPCRDLFPSMYCCVEPERSTVTFQPVGCQRNSTVAVDCFARHGVECDGTAGFSSQIPFNESVLCDGEWYPANNVSFQQMRECFFVDEDNIYDLDTALALSVFFGMFGFDRFYLGYPAIGLAKMLTLGGFFVGQLIDIVLITLQVVGPADGTSYRIPFDGPRMTRLFPDNETYHPPST